MSNTVNSHTETRTGIASHHLSVDELFDVLSEKRRRTTLSVLADSDSGLSVEELAVAVATRECDDTPATASESMIKDVHGTLHHIHLPKLDEAALVKYDRNGRTVETTSTGDAVAVDIE